jgi:thiol:disulfide interchange protein DsbD
VLQGLDPYFDMEVKKFKGWASFTQRVTVTDATLPITGRLEFTTCNDQMCLPPEVQYFRIVLRRNEVN